MRDRGHCDVKFSILNFSNDLSYLELKYFCIIEFKTLSMNINRQRSGLEFSRKIEFGIIFIHNNKFIDKMHSHH